VSRLKLHAISKSYGAIQALSSVALSIEPGEVLGLMGDNGAGKSTLVKIIAGNFPPTTGEILIDGRPVSFYNPRDAQKEGIEVVYQDLALCDNQPLRTCSSAERQRNASDRSVTSITAT
jgi:simple sugar transport system ATP-binding protein